MLSPDIRSVAMDLLRPSAGYRLDQAVLTTYSLDLEALLALPLSVLATNDAGLEELLADPLVLLEALREAGSRVHVFVDHGAIAIPRAERSIYAMLEASVIPVKAPNKGAFHPKLWVARFINEAGEALVRVAVLSRNLTYDRSWDIALASEAVPGTGKRAASSSKALGNLLHALPGMAVEPASADIIDLLEELAGQVSRTRFPSPEGFDGEVYFDALGLDGVWRKPWVPFDEGSRVLAIAPFVNRRALEALEQITWGERMLVSRQESLDAMPEDALASWETLVMADAAEGEDEDVTQDRPNGLHAKMIAIEGGSDVSWSVGSANITAAAFLGRNVEVMATVTGRKGRKDGKTGSGVHRFLDGGFRALCEPYHPSDVAEADDALQQAQHKLEQAREAIVEDESLCVSCQQHDDAWQWCLNTTVTLADVVSVTVWPITINEEQARPLASAVTWRLPTARLTAFVAFCISVPGVAIDDARLTMKLPVTGMPDDRMAHVLHSLVDSTEKLMRFLRALLGGFDSLTDWAMEEGQAGEREPWGAGLGADTLLEDLVRVASRDPERLAPVKKLIDDLRASEEGRKIVPDDLYEVWSVVESTIQQEHLDVAP